MGTLALGTCPLAFVSHPMLLKVRVNANNFLHIIMNSIWHRCEIVNQNPPSYSLSPTEREIGLGSHQASGTEHQAPGTRHWARRGHRTGSSHLGALLGPSWAILGHLRPSLGPLRALLGPSWAVLGRHGAILKPSGAVSRARSALSALLLRAETLGNVPSRTMSVVRGAEGHS